MFGRLALADFLDPRPAHDLLDGGLLGVTADGKSEARSPRVALKGLAGAGCAGAGGAFGSGGGGPNGMLGGP
jgi:hypothetical protein